MGLAVGVSLVPVGSKGGEMMGKAFGHFKDFAFRFFHFDEWTALSQGHRTFGFPARLNCAILPSPFLSVPIAINVHYAGPLISLSGEKIGAGGEIRNVPFADVLFGRFYVFRRPGIELKQSPGEGNQPKGGIFLSPLFSKFISIPGEYW